MGMSKGLRAQCLRGAASAPAGYGAGAAPGAKNK